MTEQTEGPNGGPPVEDLPVHVVAEVRCTACSGNRGQPLIAVVYSDHQRKWLIVNPNFADSEDAAALKYIVHGDGDSWRGIQFVRHLEEAMRDYPWIVMSLEEPSEIQERDPLISVSCPRCSPSGYNSSWFLDCRKIGQRLKGDQVVRIKAPEVAADGDDRPVIDRDLGYRPHRERDSER